MLACWQLFYVAESRESGRLFESGWKRRIVYVFAKEKFDPRARYVNKIGGKANEHAHN